ncbi:UNVERIFIED_CONTAM: hypothetical protein PYX00_008609 [Menopon gallinae]|uniref:Transmembrane protein 200A n=1 Tax=Menopon gallinae TaxID=328185 RepID=A0AAW2HPL4_9NEOP
MAANNPKQVQSYSGQWNVQVVRGKVTTRCLWNACKALSIGLFLMTIGAAMAIVGYYADQLSIRNEIRGNSTVKIKNESRGFHLNNLSYAGPIIMGIGGFIVVAACVMTFEARDSAAKVVPARFKPSMNSSTQLSSTKSTPHTLRSLQRLDSKMNTSCQTPVSKGSYKLSNLGSGDRSPVNDPLGRKLLTSAFVQFSRALMEDSLDGSRHVWRKTNEANLNKSPSAPNLSALEEALPIRLKHNDEATKKKRTQRHQEKVRAIDRCTLLSPQLLQRQALSVDNQFYDTYGCCTPPSPSLCRQCSGKSAGSHDSLHMELGASAGVSGSQASMALDLHDCQVTLKVKDESQNRRSDISRRHQLLRQKPVEDDPYRCSCTSQMIYTNTSDDSVIKTKPRSEGPSCKILQPSKKNFSRSRSCTDDRLPTDKRIYCLEDHKKGKFPSAEKLKCSSDQRSPSRINYHIHRRVDTSRCALHCDQVTNQFLIRKNAKRRKSSQKTEEDSHSTTCRSPTLKSRDASPVKDNSPSPNNAEDVNQTGTDPS